MTPGFKKIIAAVLIAAAAVVLFTWGYRYYTTKTPDGILWANDIANRDIRAQWNSGSYRFYLYETGNGSARSLGLLSMNKQDGWRLDEHERVPVSGAFGAVKVRYVEYEDADLRVHYMWGAVADRQDGNEYRLTTGTQEIYKPDYIKEEKGKAYMFIGVKDNTGETLSLLND